METATTQVHFTYKARDRQGGVHRGRLEAAGPEEAASFLEQQGLYPVVIHTERVQGSRTEKAGLLERFLPVKKQELIVFSRQMATLLDAGLPILKGLKLAGEQMRSAKFRAALEQVSRSVEHGCALSEAFAAHPGIFPALVVGMVRAGESSGRLQEVMERLADLLEFEAATEQRVKAATRYPKLVVGALAIAFVVLMSAVVPKFVGMFSAQHVALPLPTRMLIRINDLVQQHGLLLLAGTALAVFGWRRFSKTPRGRFLVDGLLLRLPVLGRLNQLIAMSRFSKILSLLLRSGVPILKAFEMVSETVGNSVVAAAVGRVRAEVEKGSGVSRPMRTSGFFPPMVVQMVAIGEETGRLDALVGKVASYYDAEADYLIKNLTTYLEPMILLLLGGMVAFLALAIFMPMWSVMDLAKGGM